MMTAVLYKYSRFFTIFLNYFIDIFYYCGPKINYCTYTLYYIIYLQKNVLQMFILLAYSSHGIIFKIFWHFL